MKKAVLISAAVVAIGAAIAVWYFNRDTVDMSAYEHLKEPSIRNMPDQKVIETVVKGDPGQSAGKAIGALYKVYYKLPEHPGAPPRARWSNIEQGKENFVGTHAIPIAETITQLPEGTNSDVRIATWEYGEVAEILHTGSYDTEEANVQRLLDYVKQNGYEIVGVHEEEYLVGPGMFGMKSPEKYQTIIRYRVKKIG